MTRYAWALGFAGTLCLVVAGSFYYLFQSFDGRVTGFLVAGAVLLLAYAFFDRETLQETTSSRSFGYGSLSLVLQAMAVLLGAVVFVLSERYDQTWDITRDGAFTLSDQSLEVIGGLEEPVTFLAFFEDGPARLGVERQLDLYDQASDRIEVQWIDPLANPRQAEAFDVTDGYTLVIQQGDRTQRIQTEVVEENITNKLVLVQSDADHRICWSVGHGESDPDDEFSEEGLGNMVIALEALNFTVEKARIAQEGIDRGCEALIVARPLGDWLPYEREALAAYVAEGGRVMVLLDDAPALYAIAAEASGKPPPQTAVGFEADLERFGFTVGDDIVLDPDPRAQLMGVDDPSLMLVTGTGIVQHPITQNLTASILVRVGRSLTLDEGAEGLAMYPLLRAGPDSWGETDLANPPEPSIDSDVIGEVVLAAWMEVGDPAALAVVTPGADAPEGLPSPPEDGPLPGEAPVDLDADLARAVPRDFTPRPGGKVIVFGDTDFATNQWYNFGNNRDLFLNSVAWLVGEEDQIGERPAAGDTLEITGVEAGLLLLTSMFFVPGAAALVATVTLVRRRYL